MRKKQVKTLKCHVGDTIKTEDFFVPLLPTMDAAICGGALTIPKGDASRNHHQDYWSESLQCQVKYLRLGVALHLEEEAKKAGQRLFRVTVQDTNQEGWICWGAGFHFQWVTELV